MNNTLTGFGVVVSRGLFATMPDVIRIVEGTFRLTGEGERHPVDLMPLPEDVWLLQAPYPQSHVYAEEADLILPTLEEAKAARLEYIHRELANAQYVAFEALQRAQALAENLSRPPVVDCGP